MNESQVQESFNSLFKGGDFSEDTFEKAETLLESYLRPESPLKHRLNRELQEIRRIHKNGKPRRR